MGGKAKKEIKAIDKIFEEIKKEYVIHWYKREIKCEKDFLNEYRESNDQYDLY